MGKISLYIKRGINYVLREYKQPIIYAKIFQKTPTEIFNGKTFLITGGSSGLGFYIAKRLVSEKARVIITGRNEENLKKAQSELGKLCDYLVFDISSSINQFDEIFNELYKKYKYIDGIVNNAGISLHEWDFMKVGESEFDSQFLTNLKGGYFFTQSYIKHYLENNQSEGKIIFISSERGTMCDDLPYGLTKTSINSLVKALSFKYYKKGLNINAISPGVTASKMTGINKDGDLYSDNISQRFFVPEEVAEVAIFLLSDYSKCISGEIIHTNAGNHLKRSY